jgi:hypothetical protein
MAFIKVGNKVLKFGGNVLTNDVVLFVSLGGDGKTLSITPSTDIAEKLTRYMLVLTPATGTPTEVDIGSSGTYQLQTLYGTVPNGMYTLSVYAVLTGGNSKTFGRVEYYVLPPCAAMTLRFQFSQDGYDPNVLQTTQWNKGTWTHMMDNVWDWTYDNTSWATVFGAGKSGVPGAFSDDANMVKVIDCGDTSTVTDVSRCFQNCTALSEVRALDTSGATTATLMFSHCEALQKVCNLDLSNSGNNIAVFQCAYGLLAAPNIQFATAKSYSCQNFFAQCSRLKCIPVYDLRRCTNLSNFLTGVLNSVTVNMDIEQIPELSLDSVTDIVNIFNHCTHIKRIHLKNLNNLVKMTSAFAYCSSAVRIDLDGICKVTHMAKAFYECSSLTSLPWMDLGSVVTLDSTFDRCSSLVQIPLYDLHSCTILNGTFQKCPNIHHLPKFDTSNVTDFANCCNGTDAGTNSLEEIPDWDFSKGTSFSCAFKNNVLLTDISGLRVPSATNVDQMFRGCRNVETGITELYEHLSTKAVSVTSHQKTFENTGADTVTGAAELAQVPTSWGGTMST